MKDKLQAIREKALEAMNTGELTLPRLDEIKIEYLGKKGTLTALLRGMARSLPKSARSSDSWPTRSGRKSSRPLMKRKSG